MDESKIIELIQMNYDIKINSIEKIKNTYKINTEEGGYCVKVIKYQYPHFYFILSAILHLQERQFETIPEILMTRDKECFIKFFDKYAYLTKWIPGRLSNFDNPLELAMVSEKLGELHICSEGFDVTANMKPRVGWFSWIDVFKTRRDEILDFKHRISQKAYKSKFDLMYLECLKEEINRAERSISGLEKSNYIQLMEREVLRGGFCHHDYANHNILIDENSKINIIDFDYCILDSHTHDLSSLMIRAMKNGKWDIGKADYIIKNYSLSNKVSNEELSIMKEFIRFPQGFWQLGIQMYWEQQPWEEKNYLGRLNRYIEDRDDREDFVNRFF